MSDREKKIIDAIKEQKISPLPAWVFQAKNIAIWVLCILSVGLGSVSLSYLIFFIQWNDLHTVALETPSVFLSLAPLLWIVAFLLFVGLAFFGQSHTERGYRIPGYLWVLINLLATFVIAFLLLLCGIPEHCEMFLKKGMPNMSASHMEEMLWNNPRKGMVHGRIEGIQEHAFLLEDPSGKLWTVTTKNLPERLPLIHTGSIVRVMGKEKSEDEIQAKRILPGRRPPERPRRDVELRPPRKERPLPPYRP